jgi:hypothetical protein
MLGTSQIIQKARQSDTWSLHGGDHHWHKCQGGKACDDDHHHQHPYVGSRLEYSHHSSVGRKRQSSAVFPTTHGIHDRWSEIKNKK